MTKRTNSEKKRDLAKRAFMMGVEWCYDELSSPVDEDNEEHRIFPAALQANAAEDFDSEEVYAELMEGARQDGGKANGDRPDTTPDWSGKCETCNTSPIVPTTGLCGPCTFGEADTAGGNW